MGEVTAPKGDVEAAKPLKSSWADPENALSRRFVPESQLSEPDGSWLRGAAILTTSTAQPSLLGLPFAMACLGWAGGICVMLASAAASTYCALLVARLHHHGGKRHDQYRTLAREVMGPNHPYAYKAVLALQFSVIVGVGVANLILAAECLGAIYALYCTDDTCNIKNWAWTLIAAAGLAVLTQCPDMARAEVLTTLTSAFMVVYSVSAVALAGAQGGGEGVSYSIPGNTVNRVMNGFNAIGIAVFVFTNIIIPEVQSTLRLDPSTGSAYPPMRTSILVSWGVLVTPMYLLVAVVGYWAYGNAVPGFLLSANTHPAWLLTILNLLCVFTLLVGEQIFEFLLYDSWESKLVAKFVGAKWLHVEHRSEEGRPLLVPSRACMLLVRVPYVLCIAIVAATFPFFSEIMGFVGAVGLTPLAFIIPIAMYLIAKHGELSVASYWAHVALGTTFTVAGILATIGAVRGIVVAIQSHEFYS